MAGENTEYKSQFTGEQIDALLEKVDERVSQPASGSDALITAGGVYTGLDGKVDKVQGKGLSQNDYTNAEKSKLAGLPTGESLSTQLGGKVDKETGKGLSSNDYTNSDKVKLGALPDKDTLDAELDAKANKDTDAVAGNLAKFDSNGNPVDAGESLDDINERLLDLSKPQFCEGLVDTISAGTRQSFINRQSGGDGVNHIKAIAGKTIVWTQLVQNGDFADVSIWETYTAVSAYSVSGNIATFDKNAAEAGWISQQVNLIAGHKYYYAATLEIVSGSGNLGVGFIGDGSANVGRVYTESKGRVSNIYEMDSTTANIGIFAIRPSNAFVGTCKASNVILIDLTLLGLGDLTTAQFEARYPKLYYAYNSGLLKNNDYKALLTRGFNRWDEEWEVGSLSSQTGGEVSSSNHIRSKNFCPCFGGANYYAKSPSSTIFILILFYDADKNYLTYVVGRNEAITAPSSAAYFKIRSNNAGEITAYKNDICINLSDASRNGLYEPHWKREIQFRIKELTGVPAGGTEADRVLVAPNGAAGAGSAEDLFFVENGETKFKKVMLEEVDLGDLNWSLSATIPNVFVSDGIPDKIVQAEGVSQNLICGRYVAESVVTLASQLQDKRTTGNASGNKIVVKDTAYTDAGTFKTVNTGVKLIAEAATPIVYTDLRYADGTPFELPKDILVDELGTEEAIQPDGATTPSAPFQCDSTYSISIANLVRKLNE